MQEGIRLGEKTEVKKELGRSHLICADSTDRIVGQVGRDALAIESEAVQNCLGVQMRDESLHIKIFLWQFSGTDGLITGFTEGKPS